jgi:FtsH-binding integral membrane protein
MGYGLGIFLAALGLILVYALEVDIPGISATMLGWILVIAGLLVVVLTAVQMNSRRKAVTTERTTHADGSQTVQQRSTDQDPPPAV